MLFEEILEIDMGRQSVCNNHGVLSHMLFHYFVDGWCAKVVKDEHLDVVYDFPNRLAPGLLRKSGNIVYCFGAFS